MVIFACSPAGCSAAGACFGACSDGVPGELAEGLRWGCSLDDCAACAEDGGTRSGSPGSATPLPVCPGMEASPVPLPGAAADCGAVAFPPGCEGEHPPAATTAPSSNAHTCQLPGSCNKVFFVCQWGARAGWHAVRAIRSSQEMIVCGTGRFLCAMGITGYHEAFGCRMIFIPCFDSAVWNASSICSRGKRCVMSGSTLTKPLSNSSTANR